MRLGTAPPSDEQAERQKEDQRQEENVAPRRDIDEDRDREPPEQNHKRERHGRGVATGGVPYTSISSASPWPPPEQMAARPKPPPLRRNS
jgi:hypothetical protein